MKIEKREEVKKRIRKQDIIDGLASKYGEFNFAYLRDNEDKRIGVVVSIPKNGSIFMGASFLNPLDSFDLEKGLEIALSRAESGDKLFNFGDIPSSIDDNGLDRMIFMQEYVTPLLCRSARRWYDKRNK